MVLVWLGGMKIYLYKNTSSFAAILHFQVLLYILQSFIHWYLPNLPKAEQCHYEVCRQYHQKYLPVDVRVIVDAQPAGVITHHCPVDDINGLGSNCFTQDNGYHHNPGGGCQIQFPDFSGVVTQYLNHGYG